MSTKIYNAYRLPKKNIHKFFAVVQKYKNENYKTFIWDCLEFCTQEYGIEFVDSAIKWGTTVFDTPEETKKYQTHLIKSTQARYSYEGTRILNASLYLKGNFYYVRFYGHYKIEHDFIELLEKQNLGLQDFHYQNSTDRPDNVSAREWRNRLKIWEDIIFPIDYGNKELEISVIPSIMEFRRLDESVFNIVYHWVSDYKKKNNLK